MLWLIRCISSNGQKRATANFKQAHTFDFIRLSLPLHRTNAWRYATMNWCDRVVLMKFTDSKWRENFGISRSSFNWLNRSWEQRKQQAVGKIVWLLTSLPFTKQRNKVVFMFYRCLVDTDMTQEVRHSAEDAPVRAYPTFGNEDVYMHKQNVKIRP